MKLASWSILAGLATALPTNPPDQYEYIIIGSGPGGGTLASVFFLWCKPLLIILPVQILREQATQSS